MDAEEKARKAATLRVHAHLDLQHLYVKAEDFEFPVVSSINFDYEAQHPDAPTADGTVHVPQGSVSALGHRFTIQNARLHRLSPAADARAWRECRRGPH